MKIHRARLLRRLCILALLVSCGIPLAAGEDPPLSWIDPDTGHRIIRLTREPGSASLYFNQNGYTADGKKLVYTTPEGISVLDLATRETRILVQGRVRIVEAGRKTQQVYYVKEGLVFATDADSGAARQIGKLPRRGNVSTVNADETLLAGTYIEGEGPDYGGGIPAQAQRESFVAGRRPRSQSHVVFGQDLPAVPPPFAQHVPVPTARTCSSCRLPPVIKGECFSYSLESPRFFGSKRDSWTPNCESDV